MSEAEMTNHPEMTKIAFQFMRHEGALHGPDCRHVAGPMVYTDASHESVRGWAVKGLAEGWTHLALPGEAALWGLDGITSAEIGTLISRATGQPWRVES